MQIHLYLSIDSPYQWAIVNNEQGSIVENGEVESLNDLKFERSIDLIILVANGIYVASHRVTVPGNSRTKAIGAIPFALEEKLTDDIEALHFAIQHWGEGQATDILVVKDELIQTWLKKFKEVDLNADDVVPEYLLVPRHPGADVTIVQSLTGDLIIRSGDNSGTVIDESMLDLWWDMEAKDKIVAINNELLVKSLIAQGREGVQFWDIGYSISDWIKNGGSKKLIFPCLLQGKYDDSGQIKTRSNYKVAVNLVLAGVIIYISSLLLNQFYLEYKSGSLESKAGFVYQTAFPELINQQAQDPVFEMRKAISGLKSGTYQYDNFLPAFQIVANELKDSESTTLTNLIFEDDMISAQVDVPDFAVLDALFLRLAAVTQAFATVDTKNAIAQDNTVQGVLEISLKQD